MSVAMLLTRDRHQPKPELCTLGRLIVNGRGFDSLEAGDGAIFPAGTYRVEPRTCDAFGQHWALVNLSCGAYSDPAHGALFLLRSGGMACDLFSAIGIGKARARMPSGEWVLKESRSAINELRTVINGSLDVTLEIV
jgi:hypothetical protein